jgi:S-DNA-T family DNA segregation ATPase FtsK/SpoIIIE
VFRLADAGDAASLGTDRHGTASLVPGRCVLVPGGDEAQVAVILPRPDGRCAATAAPIERLPERVDQAALPAASFAGSAVHIPLGIAYDSLQTATLAWPPGEHVMVLGPPRSGRSSALAVVAGAWGEAHPGAWIGTLATRRPGCRAGRAVGDLARLAEVPPDAPALLVVDDAELVDDPADELAALCARCPQLTIAAAARPEALRSAYGHWTQRVRHSRLGLVLAASSDLDGDLLGVTLPRRPPIPPRPGLAWLADGGPPRLVQIALPRVIAADDGGHLTACGHTA